MGILFFIRVPYTIGDLKRDPNLANYPYILINDIVSRGLRFCNEPKSLESFGSGF